MKEISQAFPDLLIFYIHILIASVFSLSFYRSQVFFQQFLFLKKSILNSRITTTLTRQM